MTLVSVIYKYVERLLSPSQLWAVLTIVSTGLLLCPDEYTDALGLTNLVASNKWVISLILIISAAILIVKVIVFAARRLHRIISRQSVEAENLTDEEKAILVFFTRNNFESFRARRDCPAIRKLVARNFIASVYSCIIISGDPYEGFELTKLGRKKLQSQKFYDNISAPFSTDQVLRFINTISEKQYSIQEPYQFN